MGSAYSIRKKKQIKRSRSSIDSIGINSAGYAYLPRSDLTFRDDYIYKTNCSGHADDCEESSYDMYGNSVGDYNIDEQVECVYGCSSTGSCNGYQKKCAKPDPKNCDNLVGVNVDRTTLDDFPVYYGFYRDNNDKKSMWCYYPQYAV